MNWKHYIMLIVGLCCLTILGCASFVDMLTPVRVSDASYDYLNIESDGGWVSLDKARQMRNEIIITHRDNQIKYLRDAEDDKMYFNDAIIIQENIKSAEELQTLMIGSETQPFSVLGILAGAFPGLALGGALLKRPKDYTPEQVETIVARRLQEKK